MSMKDDIKQWRKDPCTIESAIMSLTAEERAESLRILRKLKSAIYTNSQEAGVMPVEWDGMTADNLLEAFEDAEEAIT